MAKLAEVTPYSFPFKLNMQDTQLTEEQFVRLCRENPDLRIELTAQGELVFMPPTGLNQTTEDWHTSSLEGKIPPLPPLLKGGTETAPFGKGGRAQRGGICVSDCANLLWFDSESGRRNIRLARRVDVWAEVDGTGLAFDSSTLFTLPNGAKRSPDASWVRRERWEALSERQRAGFGLLCPDFVVELRSPTDRLADLQEKMQEYLDNGARLGWLVDPIEKRVYVYRPGPPVEPLDDPPAVSGDPVLPGFTLHVRELW